VSRAQQKQAGDVKEIRCVSDPFVDCTTCIHNLDLADLAKLWLEGVRCLRIAASGCVACQADPGRWLTDTVHDFNQLASSRGMDGFSLDMTRRDTPASPKKPEPENMSRRGFLRRFAAPQETEQEEKIQPEQALQQFLALGGKDAIYPFSPDFDPALCTACDECQNICLDDALTLIKAPDGKLYYSSDADRCTGCHMCSDVCPNGAIKILTMAGKGIDMLITEFQCRACGVTSHSSPAHPADDNLCKICQTTQHHKKLFVVLD